jgi:hypothetical protein
METTLYICADGTLTYGPFGGQDKIIPQALPIGVVESEKIADDFIHLVGRSAYDAPGINDDFQNIKPGYGPTSRFYYSLPGFERNNVETVFTVAEEIKPYLEKLK